VGVALLFFSLFGYKTWHSGRESFFSGACIYHVILPGFLWHGDAVGMKSVCFVTCPEVVLSDDSDEHPEVGHVEKWRRWRMDKKQSCAF
jgi:hypothetical protein